MPVNSLLHIARVKFNLLTQLIIIIITIIIKIIILLLLLLLLIIIIIIFLTTTATTKTTLRIFATDGTKSNINNNVRRPHWCRHYTCKEASLVYCIDMTLF